MVLLGRWVTVGASFMPLSVLLVTICMYALSVAPHCSFSNGVVLPTPQMKKLRPRELKWLIETMELRQGLLGCGSLFPSADRVPSLPSSGSLSQLPLSAAQGHVALKMALPAGTLPPLW